MTYRMFHSRPIFNDEGITKGFAYRLRDDCKGKSKSTKRRNLSTLVPEVLNLPQMLTKRQLDSVEYKQMEPDMAYYLLDDNGRSYHHATLVSPEMTHDDGLWDRLARIQELFTRRNFRVETNYPARGGAYDLGITVETGHHFIWLGTTLQNAPLEVCEAVHELTKIAVGILEKHVAPEDLKHSMFEQRHITEGNLTMGSEKNIYFSGFQLNHSSINTAGAGQSVLTDDIAQFGGLHVDSNDERSGYTVMISLTHCPNTYFPGRFNLTAPRLTAPFPPFSALIFKGVYPHFGTGGGRYTPAAQRDPHLRIQLDNGLQYPPIPRGNVYKCIGAVSFPNKECLHPKRQYMRDNLYDEEKALLRYYGTKRNMYTTYMRLALKDEFKWMQDAAEINPEEW